MEDQGNRMGCGSLEIPGISSPINHHPFVITHCESRENFPDRL
jgi:hypothetical protein